MPAIGDVLAGRYRIVAPLGAGGMATVYLAHDERLDRDVAVKILLPNHAGDPILAARFEREARSMAAAAHPGVVAVYDVDPGDPTAGQEPFFVMELCTGGSLAERLAAGQRMPPDDLVPILISVADGLAGLHARGVVHRDVKPSNIMLAGDRAKLADFGLARPDDPSDRSDLTAPGTAVGTMAYLAPEALAGGAASAAGDVYALGVAAFAGLTGTLPRTGASLAEVVAASQRPATLVSAAAPDLGRAFDEPVAAALDPDPAARPDALAFASLLTTGLGQWSRARPPVPQPPAPVVEGDFDATTAIVSVPPPEPAPARPVPPPEPSPTSATPAGTALRPGRGLAAVSAVVVLTAFAAWMLAGGAPLIGGAPTNEPRASGVASPSIGASASASAAPAPSPSPPLTVADRALVALDEVDAAIAAAAGGGGLKGKERNDLERRANLVRGAVEDGDFGAARKAADELDDKAHDLAKGLSEARATRLLDATQAVVEVLRGG